MYVFRVLCTRTTTKDSKESKEFAKALDDLRREHRADFRCLKDRTRGGFSWLLWRPITFYLLNKTTVFNYRSINIDTIGNDIYATDFNDLVLSYASSNVVTLATRITSESSTFIDVCVTNMDQTELFPGFFCQDISDNLFILSLSRVPVSNNTNNKKGCSFIKINAETLDSFKELVECFYWSSVYLEGCADAAYSKFFRIFKNLYGSAFPVVETRKGKQSLRKP